MACTQLQGTCSAFSECRQLHSPTPLQAMKPPQVGVCLDLVMLLPDRDEITKNNPFTEFLALSLNALLQECVQHRVQQLSLGAMCV